MIDSHLSIHSSGSASKATQLLFAGQQGGRFWALLILVVISAGFSGTTARADIKTAPNKKIDKARQEKFVPVPVAVDTKVIRGSMVEFIVRAPTASSKRVDFIVRSEPEVGRLEGPVPVDGDNHGSRFGYHCPADSEIDLVVVEIAARLPGGGVSKAVPMRIFIEDAVAILETKPKMVRFEKALVGNPTRYSGVELTNIGNTPFKGGFSFPRGWGTHNLDGEIEIAPGETHRFGLRYTATEAGFADEVRRLQSGVEESALHLVAEAIQPISMTPGKLDLVWDEGTQSRRGTLSVQNRDAENRTLHILGSDRLRIPGSLTIKPGARRKIEVVLPPDDIDAFSGRIVAKSGLLQIGVSAEAHPTPPRVAIVEPENRVLDFGQAMQEGRAKVMGIIFENSGGTSTPITLRPIPPFSVLGGEDGMEVLGGGTRLVHIRAETATAGRFDRVLTAQAGGVHLPLKVTFEVMAPDAVAIDTGVRGIVLELNEPEKLLSLAAIQEMDGSLIFNDLEQIPEELTKRMAQQAFYGVSPFDRHFRDDLPEVGDLHFVDAQRSAFTFGFEPVKGAISYVVEMGTVVYHPKSKLLTKEWRGLRKKNLRLSTEPGEVQITLRGIPKGAGREIRVFAVFPGKVMGRPCPPVFFQTLPPLVIPWKTLGVIIGVVFLVLGVFAYRNADEVVEVFKEWVGSALARRGLSRSKEGYRPPGGREVTEDFDILPAKKRAPRKKTDTQKLDPDSGISPPVPVNAMSEKNKRKKTDTQKLAPKKKDPPDNSDPFTPGDIPTL